MAFCSDHGLLLLVLIGYWLSLLSPQVQALRVPRNALEINVQAPNQESINVCDPNSETEVLDLSQIAKEFKNNASTLESWRSSQETLSFNSLSYLRKTSKLTDCVFLVGPDGQEKQISAHCVILAAASPVFEAATQKSSLLFRLLDWQPLEFEQLLSFIYSGDVCFNNFDEACNMLKKASFLEVDSVRVAARSFITAHLHKLRSKNSNPLWEALNCARQAADQTLLNNIYPLISERTSELLKETKFEEVLHQNLVDLMKRDDLKVNSEVELYDALTRWSIAQMEREELEPTSKLIRKFIGPEIFKNIRFLTMTEADLTRLRHDGILSYSESLVVHQNILIPGVMPIPKTLSSSRTKRSFFKNTTYGELTFKPIPVKYHKCGSFESTVNINDFNPIKSLSLLDRNYSIIGIQIPRSQESMADKTLKEHFDIFILDSADNIVFKHKYNQVPEHTRNFSPRYTYEFSSSEDTRMIDPKLITAWFNSRFTVTKNHKVTIVFHESWHYPYFVDAGASIASTNSLFSRTGWTRGNYDAYMTFHNRPFIYSIIEY